MRYFIAVNGMPSSFESRKLTGNTHPTANLQQKNLIMMNSDEIIQVRCMYDQFYNIIMAGFPIDITVRVYFDSTNLRCFLYIEFRTIEKSYQ
jgi:hypothetical protein